MASLDDPLRISAEKDISQMVSLRKDVLLAFVYFDRNLCNYILEKDLEQIISTLGLHLSRAQIKQVLSKVCSQNMCLYRTLTDGWEGDLEKLENKSLITEDMLLGNHHLLPSCPGVPPSKPRTRSGDTTLMEYNGNMVNVGNLIQKLERDERNRAEMENKLQSVESQLAETLGKLSSNDSVNKSLSSGMQEMQKQVSELEDRVKAAEKLKVFYELRLQDNTRNLNSMIEDIQRIIKKMLPEQLCFSSNFVFVPVFEHDIVVFCDEMPSWPSNGIAVNTDLDSGDVDDPDTEDTEFEDTDAIVFEMEKLLQ
eukprot:g46565.t1